MDPISLTSIITASLGVADVITRLSYGLKRLQDDFSGALDHVDNIIQQTGTVDLAIREICLRLETTPETFPQSFESHLTDSTTAIRKIIEQLELHAQAVKDGAKDSQAKGRIIHIRHAAKVQQWGASLAAQIQALSLLLQVAQLRSSGERMSVLEQESSKKLFERASSMSAKHENSPCNLSTGRSCSIEIQNFVFDSTLLETKVYRRACESLWRREITQNVVDTSGNTSVPASLVSSNDAIASQTDAPDPEPPDPSNAPGHELFSSFSKRHDASQREYLAPNDSNQETVSISAGLRLRRTSLPTPTITAVSSSIHANEVAAAATMPSTAGRRGHFDCQKSSPDGTPDDMDVSCQEYERGFRPITQKNKELESPMNLGPSVQPHQNMLETSMTYTTTSSSSTGPDTSATGNSSSTQKTGATVATTVPSISDSKASHSIQSEANSSLGMSVVTVNVEQVGSDYVDLAVHEVSRHYDIVRDSIARIRDNILIAGGIDPVAYCGHLVSCTIETCGEAVHKFPFTAAFLAAALEKMEEGLYSSIDILAQFSMPYLQNTSDVAAQTITSKHEIKERNVHKSVGTVLKPTVKTKGGVPHFIFGKNYHMSIPRKNPVARGGYSHIFKAQIYLGQYGFVRKPMMAAIKKLHSTDYNAFKREAHILRHFSRQSETSLIIRLLATFEYEGYYHLVFPWASGNLLEYWRDHDPYTKLPKNNLHSSIGNIHAMLHQCAGIASAVTQIHSVLNKPALSICASSTRSQRRFGRHGDLKPGNILYFVSKTGPSKLVIADMGIAQFHDSSQIRTSSIPRPSCTPTYRAPEYDLLSTGVKTTSAYDVWSMGCIFLEFTIWLLTGDARRRAFGCNRSTYDKDGAFFITRDGELAINPAVDDELNALDVISASFTPILHGTIVPFLEIIKSCLEIEDDKRPTAESLSKQLQSLQNGASLMKVSLQEVKIAPTLDLHTDVIIPIAICWHSVSRMMAYLEEVKVFTTEGHTVNPTIYSREFLKDLLNAVKNVGRTPRGRIVGRQPPGSVSSKVVDHRRTLLSHAVERPQSSLHFATRFNYLLFLLDYIRS
ncbi:hypothetical protein GGR58DRAFT_419484 [Xylaria digitata]|nr:hypothetical protein GGR58DRAFT_419484 [Xylaria digitata]